MADRFSEQTRSYIMSRIKGKWTGPEKTLHDSLGAAGIVHVMHPKMPGNPDAYVPSTKAAVFVDGCFWHGCPKHSHPTKTNREFWTAKIARNMERDYENTNKLKAAGYSVLRIWECETDTKLIGKYVSRLDAHYRPRRRPPRAINTGRPH